MVFADEGLEILDEAECLRLVEGARIGRLAVCRGSISAVLPVAFILVGGEVFFFTGSGTKWDAALRQQLVTFEVDELNLDTNAGWSVMIVGQALAASAAMRARAEALGLCPWAAGERHHLVRVRPDFVSGRRLLQ
jgi:nitroimidazol reductase NimA-like FMN-containing flavoprotein (pyridoxamine 5'-phosphate oxidase superfamily)